MKFSHLFQDVFYKYPDAIIAVNQEGTIILENRMTPVLFGYEPGELIGHNIEVLLPEYIKGKHHRYLEKYSHNPKPREMSTNRSLTAVKKTGEEFYVAISLDSFVKKDQTFFLATIRDISEYVNTNKQLEATLFQLRKILQTSKMGTWELDHVSGELFWSDEVFRIFGVDQNRFVPNEKTFYQLIHKDDRQMVCDAYYNSLKNKIPYNIVHRIILSNGEIKYLRERCETKFDDKGSPVKSWGSVQDVSEEQIQKVQLKGYLKKMEIKNQELEEYTFIAAHDLQEPINTILGVCSILKEELKTEKIENPEIPNYLDFVVESSLRLKTLIKGVMDTARLGKFKKFEEINLNQLLEKVRKDLYIRLKESHTELSYPILPHIRGNFMEIKLLFQNLISNSIKFKKKDEAPSIKINFNDQGNGWMFWIEDNGIGIDPRYKDKLFRLFKRLHTIDDYEGTGLGLAQCKKIVELHNGEIWFESEVGKGTVFYFTISKILV
ncbi:PAS domain-containing sensor histidine kinase [Arthrospiribacter ruber]|uniref:histidine kinase n=1 Tax=Arthrospiribacter ruber TaxID=2487934 RepID=A0A951IV10_9BACT|nr:PAS domain S-box protein [Arthrospiribacter ruber]MBW3466837.1 PAS domain S-box protein [Arthrospiribacter ruber]